MICVGIDVAKDKHDCFILSSEGEILADVFTIPNNAEGFDTLLQTIRRCAHPEDKIKVGLEATGHYSYNILGFLIDKDLPTYVINPLHTNLYRKSLSLRKTKTDRVDARTIAAMLMAEVIRLLTHHAGTICWQTADLMKTGSPFIEPLSFHSNRLFADENFRPLWIRVWKMTGSVPATALQTTSNKPAPEFDYVTAYASDAPEAYNDQEYAWVSAYAAHAFQFVKRLTREERRKWGYAGVWEIAAMRSDKGAEPQIPVELPWRCLKMHSDLHGLVLDPFAGLGTTLIACEQSGRRCRAVESDPLHCDLIVRCWEQFTGEKAEKIER